MVYLSPDAISNIATLRYLHLSSNHFNYMNVRYISDLEKNSFHFVKCWNYFINVLTQIPENLFLRNYNLRIIDLSQTHNSKVTFKIDHLKYLEYFSVSSNSILTLVGSAMMHIDNIFNIQIKDSGSIKLFCNIWDNLVECSSCKSYALITWQQKRKKSYWDTDWYCV